MQRICVFAGSSAGTLPEYTQCAQVLGEEAGRRGLGIVYGGSSVGLMGIMADAALAAGAEVIGVLPSGLFAREIAHTGLSRLEETASMHARKARMADLADAFVALPGGFGTLDELFEIITWAQIGLHTKPVGVLDVEGFFEPLFKLIEHLVQTGFVPARNSHLLVRDSDVAGLLDKLATQTEATGAATWSGPPLER